MCLKFHLLFQQLICHHFLCRYCLVFSIFPSISSYKHTHHPPTVTVTFTDNLEPQRHPPSSLEGWKLISSRSTSHNPFPYWMMSLKPSSTSCNILLSRSNHKKKKKNSMSPLSYYFISLLSAALHSHRIIAGSQGHYRETSGAESNTFYSKGTFKQRQVPKCTAFKKPGPKVIKTWKSNKNRIVLKWDCKQTLTITNNALMFAFPSFYWLFCWSNQSSLCRIRSTYLHSILNPPLFKWHSELRWMLLELIMTQKTTMKFKQQNFSLCKIIVF